MIELLRICATIRLRYRTWKLRALIWLLRRIMVRAERLSRPV
jgi:hypothetical protein